MNLVEDLGQVGLHALAFAGSEDDGSSFFRHRNFFQKKLKQGGRIDETTSCRPVVFVNVDDFGLKAGGLGLIQMTVSDNDDEVAEFITQLESLGETFAQTNILADKIIRALMANWEAVQNETVLSEQGT